MGDNKPTYKEINGTTRVGDFLRSLKDGKALNVVAELMTGDITGAIKAITESGLSPEDKAHAIKLIELDIAELENVSKRWASDLSSDSYLSKNVRPLSLIFLTVSTVILIYIDSFDQGIVVPTEWIDLLKSLLLGIYVAYFGSRGVEKYAAIGKK